MKRLYSNGGRHRAADIFTDKRCEGECGRVLDKSEFHKNVRSYDGLQDECKECGGARSAEWFRNNPEKSRIYSRRAYYKRKRLAKEEKGV